MIASVFATVDVGGILVQHIRSGQPVAVLEQSIFIFIVTFLVYGNLVYQFTRLGHLHRASAHRPADINELRPVFSNRGRGLTVLVPSYKEEPVVIEQTLWSAALQVCPDRRVVLLIDNPPDPSELKDQHLLDTTQRLPGRIERVLGEQAERFRLAYRQYQQNGMVDFRYETQRLSGLYKEASRWFEYQAKQFSINTHTDRLFIEKVFNEPAAMYRQHARLLSTRFKNKKSVILNREQIEQEYHRLMALFEVKMEYFERKKYVNLSHEANKAMNINSYLGLMGGVYREREQGGELLIEDAGGEPADLVVPDTEFVVTLDADSIIAHDYSARLIHQLDQPGNQRVAVIQTPYSAIPDAPGMLERIAGATTDIQYIIHQGFTSYRATFWVGANALLRKEALEDIVTVSRERGYEVRRYIQDRTVIEDTESSVDLVDRGWSLLNYPERLAYSATPPDFGSLLIQRRRWANGGLIIFPKLLRYLFRRPRNAAKISEGLVRSHYLTSIAAVNVGLLMLFTYPFENAMNTLWLPLTAVPYFFLYGRDMVSLNYRWSDLPRVYALNLALIPVNLGGVFKSIQQGITGELIPFGRTPKVEGRTAVPRVYVLAVLALALWCAGFAVVDLAYERWGHAMFSVFNGAFLVYAITHYLGWRESVNDLGLMTDASPEAVTVQPQADVVIELKNQRTREQQPVLVRESLLPVENASPVYMREHSIGMQER
ncbi:MAG: glycosyltransferase family 2 protein [Thiotrichales bacterium]|nr:MAG: glycosyltransferase family 2 protein [Thiotrichales bacterium]